MSDLWPGDDRGVHFLSLLRRLGLGVGAFLVVYPYFDQSMRRDGALAIGVGAGLLAFSLPAVRGRRPPATPPRGFEVIVPRETRD